MGELVDVTCPSCFGVLPVEAPAESETPCSVDYDCEVCCRPMTISFWHDDGEVLGAAYGLDD
ncbi:MAG: CPXCG motif-containing cysteine-rich protein [Verrucomicrobia bacterium]|nr:CPXCG motif-containing cysteine-rich protein [Verrucomicrobiota bacterium]